MSLINTRERFGFLTKSLHWLITILFIIEFFLVYRREYFPKGSNEKLQYLLLHKSIGITLLFLALFMILLKPLGQRPLLPLHMASIERVAAKIMHFLLYAVMLLQPISGIAMSQFAGYPIGFFNLFSLPNLVLKNEILGDLCYQLHVYTSYAIIVLVSLHALAALYHHFVKKDEVLKRMLF